VVTEETVICSFQYISNQMQLYTVYLYLETAVRVSGVAAVDKVVCAPDDGWK